MIISTMAAWFFGNGTLHSAAGSGDTRQLEVLIFQGHTSLDAVVRAPWSLPDRSESWWSPLHAAAYHCQPKSAELLLRSGASVRLLHNNTALHVAAWASGDCASVASILLKASAPVDRVSQGLGGTPLHLAARQKNTAIAQLLLEKYEIVMDILHDGMSPRDVCVHPPIQHALHNAEKALAHAAGLTHGEWEVGRLLALGRGPSGLMSAAGRGDANAVKAFVKAGVSFNVTYRSGYWSELSVGEISVPSQQQSIVGVIQGWLANEGMTALHLATLGGHGNVVRTLLKLGTDPNARLENGFSALHLAAREGLANMASLLIDGGAIPLSPVRSDNLEMGTAISIAARNTLKHGTATLRIILDAARLECCRRVWGIARWLFCSILPNDPDMIACMQYGCGVVGTWAGLYSEEAKKVMEGPCRLNFSHAR